MGVEEDVSLVLFSFEGRAEKGSNTVFFFACSFFVSFVGLARAGVLYKSTYLLKKIGVTLDLIFLSKRKRSRVALRRERPQPLERRGEKKSKVKRDSLPQIRSSIFPSSSQAVQ